MKVIGLVVVLLFCGETINGRALPHHRQDAMTGIKQSCIDEAHRGRCEFFKCFNERHPCQSNNYAMDYGWRFCSRYQINMYRLSDSGQRWLNGSRQCTMERLLNFYYEPTVSCGELASIMKDAQAACEVENGLCSGSLLRDNRDVFTDVHNIGVRSVTQFLHATKHCTMAKARMVSAWFRDRFEEFMELPAVRDIRQGINFLHEGMMREFKKVGRFLGRYEDREDVTDWSWDDDDDNRDNGFGIGFDIE